MKILILFIIVIINYNETSSLNIYKYPSSTPTKCIFNIAKKYFTSSPVITVFTSNLHQDRQTLEDILKSSNHVKRIFNFKDFKLEFFDHYIENAIILGDSLQEIITNKNGMYKLFLWNPRARYIFYSSFTEDPNLEEFVQLLWYHYMINAVVLIPSSNLSIYNIFSFFPFSSCGKNFSAKLLDKCNDGVFEVNENLYPNKLPNVLPGCLIKICIQIRPPLVIAPVNFSTDPKNTVEITEGIELEMIKVLGKFVNFSMQFDSRTAQYNWGIVSPEGNATAAMKLILNRNVDLGIGGFGAVKERYMYSDHTIEFYTENVAWCVPRAQLAPRWKNLFYVFTVTAWLGMFATYAVIASITWLMGQCNPKEISAYFILKNSIISLYSTFLGVSASTLPKKDSIRISFYFWLIFCLHFISVYQAKLVGVLLSPSYENQLSTIEEMVDSKLEHDIISSHTRLIQNSKDYRLDKILSSIKICPDVDECLYRIAYKRDLAFLIMKTFAEFKALKFRNSNGEPLLFYIPYIVLSNKWYMTKGYPLRDRFDTLILRLRDSGLLNKWQKDIENKYLYKSLMTLSKNNDEQILTISHMQGAFAILLIGLLFSFFVFLNEHLIDCLKNKTKIRQQKIY